MDTKETGEIIQKNSKFFVMFVIVLFFSLFSLSSFLLQSSSRSFFALVSNPHFILRILVIILGLLSFIYIPRGEFFKKNIFFFSFFALSYFLAFTSLVFSRHSMPSILGERIPLGFMLGISSVLLLTNNISEDEFGLEDIFLYTFVEAADIIVLLLLTDYASAFIVFLTLTVLSFHYGFTFSLRVFLLNLLIVFMVIYLFMLSPSFVQKYFDGLLQDSEFMEFFSKSSIYLASDRANATTVASSGGDIIFSFIKRFTVFGVAAFSLLLMGEIVMAFLASSYVDYVTDSKDSIRMYALSIYMGLSVIFPLLSLVTSLPIFKADMPFVSMSSIYVFLTILVFSYMLSPLYKVEKEL